MPAALAEKESPDAILIDDATPMPETPDARPAPRPIYKQTRDTPGPDASAERKSDRKSGDRVRTKVRVRSRKSGIKPAVLIAGGILFALVAIGVIVAAIRLAGDDPVKLKVAAPIDDQVVNPADGPALPTGPTIGDLPKTWSLNSPSLGFQAAWPVLPGQIGFTPVESLTVAFNGTKPNSWSLAESGSRIIMSVSAIDLLDEGTIDADETLDRYVEKIRKKAPAAIAVTSLTMGGQPARQIVAITDGDRSVSRATVLRGRLWTVSTVCPVSIKADDPRLTRFLNSFKPL